MFMEFVGSSKHFQCFALVLSYINFNSIVHRGQIVYAIGAYKN